MADLARSSRQRGDTTGYLLKLIRESVPLTQEQLATELSVERTTVQSWESGRRPFAAVPLGQAVATRQRLGRLGADPTLLSAIEDAVEADFILTSVLNDRIERTDIAEQPLGWSVLTHRLTDLLLWTVIGQTPAFIQSRQAPQRRRGPVAASPLLSADERRAFFTHLQVLAERAAGQRQPHLLLHRQACFLAGMDPSGTSEAWLAQDTATNARRRLTFHTWSPKWPDARSVATSLAKQGNPEPLRDFIARAHPDDACERAAINYSAYWVGEIPYRQRDDAFMPASTSSWYGSRLLRHLVHRLEPGHPFIDLNIHNLWSLLTARRTLIHADPDSARTLVDRSPALLDSDTISGQSRQELTSVLYSLRTNGFPGTGTSR
ncbi:helix-turn-helix transcriptional regulator [Solwaraspora sp. WMMA2101]|uniref:helix-turn-helix transcriptional regulator n=1 Tax=Solwaraspora sp. WMMA2101 TaxID=3404124 RepID=UPI003B941ABF